MNLSKMLHRGPKLHLHIIFMWSGRSEHDQCNQPSLKKKRTVDDSTTLPEKQIFGNSPVTGSSVRSDDAMIANDVFPKTPPLSTSIRHRVKPPPFCKALKVESSRNWKRCLCHTAQSLGKCVRHDFQGTRSHLTRHGGFSGTSTIGRTPHVCMFLWRSTRRSTISSVVSADVATKHRVFHALEDLPPLVDVLHND